MNHTKRILVGSEVRFEDCLENALAASRLAVDAVSNPAASVVIKNQAVANVEITNDILGTESETHEKNEMMNYFRTLVFIT